ncbi:TetR/AcrR family transcriptional regulator [Arthrobacter sp. 35W]|uniref:TetR/AcrR family transcriptional regulator n=1 Tax=Arthrobacter sp. 35W TaxID=1132441 RepID=UPI0004184D79|nr:TetR/AcrR family transcriptional regulator [Arthrobacter sp. 35W]
MPRISGTKRAILDAALELGAQHGISGTTMDEVAERAGVAKGSVYYNFSSKDKLFEELLTAGVSQLAAVLREARLAHAGWASVESMVSAMLELIRDNRALAKLMAAEIFRTDRVWQHSILVLRREVLSEFVQAIRPLNPEPGDEGQELLMAASIFGASLMGGLEWLVFSPERPVAEVSAAILYPFSGRLAQ